MVTNFVSLALGLVGLITGYVFFRLSHQGGRLACRQHSTTLVSEGQRGLPADVTVLFGDRVVPRLSRTLIILWNRGRATLRGSDVVKGDPVRFSFSPDAMVLRVQVVHATNPHNKCEAFRVTDAPHMIECSFDYLDPADGAVLEVLHTDHPVSAAPTATIRGARPAIRDLGWEPNRPSRRWLLGGRLSGLAILGLSVTYLARGMVLRYQPVPSVCQDNWVSELGIGAICFIAGVVGIWTFRRPYPKSLSVEQLKI
jgi:hypothetical protein